jgi:hypothetical protein
LNWIQRRRWNQVNQKAVNAEVMRYINFSLLFYQKKRAEEKKNITEHLIFFFVRGEATKTRLFNEEARV